MPIVVCFNGVFLLLYGHTGKEIKLFAKLDNSYKGNNDNCYTTGDVL